MTHRLRRRAALTLLAALAGCAGPPPPPPPPTVALAITAGANQNPDPTGAAAPVALHLYQLAADSRFRQADVFALVEREKPTLGADCPASDVVVVSPGETKTLAINVQPGVQFLGVVALFRDIDHSVWRAVQPVAAQGPTRLALRTDWLTMTLAPAP